MKPLLAAISLVIASGLAWTVANLGRFPHYADTIEYVRLSHTLAVDNYRGPLYPWLLHVADRLDGGDPLPLAFRWEPPWLAGRVPCAAPASAVQFQVAQILLGIAASWIFVRVFGATQLLMARLGRRTTRACTGLLVGLIAFDPLIAHFQLALMTDGLCLSASLAACAALAAFALGSSRRIAWALLLFSAVFSAAALRPEKGWVLIGAAGMSALAWGLAGRSSRRTLLTAVALTGAALACALLWHRAVRTDEGRWDLLTTVVHQRLVYPRLASIRDDLSPETREILSEEDARFYDRRIHNTWRVIDAVTDRDPERRRVLTGELARAALRAHAATIAADATADLVEHSVATPSWYARLAAWAFQGAPQSAHRQRSEMTPRTWAALSAHSPRASVVVAAIAAAGFFAATFLAILAFARWPGFLREVLVPRWAPVLFFTLGNAAVFSFTADLVHIRYAILSHVACLLLAYRGALEWAAGPPRSP